MQLARSLIEALKAHGAREIFGIPGDFALPFFKVIEESNLLPLYTLSHEPAVGFAADAAARINSTIGVAAVTYGAGAFNMVNPVTGAFAEKSPVVVISGAPGAEEGRRGLLLHHQGKSLDSQLKVFAEITCDQAVLDDPATAPAEIARVLRSCVEQSRPVYIELPRDMVGSECGSVVPAEPSPVDPDAVAACAAEILTRLDAAAAPMMMAGIELRRFRLEARLIDLARRLGIPVATSFMGRGLLAEDDAPLIGTYMGLAGKPEVTRAVEESDALFLLGVILSDTNFGVSARHIDMRHAIVAADREVRLGFHAYHEVPLADLINALLDAAGDRPAAAIPAREPAAAGRV
ncbi:MAG: thiamine pyrophosphate-binding protein, partial [Alphaproteobacteria bacterium]|nr:thiamine pyrophosphate-binding protein [Alphaproteobacteria bacterium]